MKNIMLMLAISLFFAMTSQAAESVDKKKTGDETGLYKISVMRITGYSIEADEDDNEVNKGIEFTKKVENGNGFGLSIERVLDSPEKPGIDSLGFSVGGLFLATSHHESVNYETVHSYAVYVEGIMKASDVLSPHLAICYSLNVGTGLTTLDFYKDKTQTTSGAVEGRVCVGFEVMRRFGIGFSGGAYLWGYPGETVGHGTFTAVMTSVLF